MNKNIKLALANLLNEELKVASWGISSISIGEDFISFNVDGLIYKGRVHIMGEGMEYRLTFDGGKTKICPPKDLVQALDTSIEKTPNYRNDLKTWFSTIKETRI